jgi:hypothetical protein
MDQIAKGTVALTTPLGRAREKRVRGYSDVVDAITRWDVEIAPRNFEKILHWISVGLTERAEPTSDYCAVR